MIPQQQPAPRRRPVVAIAVTVATTAVLVAAAIIGLAYALGGEEGRASAAPPTGPDAETVAACEAAASAKAGKTSPQVLLWRAKGSPETGLQEIVRRFESGGPTTGPTGNVRALTAVYEVDTWCLDNGVTTP